MFKVGDEVVCVKQHSMGVLTIGKIYRVLGTSECKCGQSIDIGITDEFGSACHDCLKVFSYTTWYFDIALFRKIERHTAKEVNVHIEFVEERIEEQQPQLV